MPLSTAHANDLVKLILAGVAIPNLADNAAGSPLAQLYLGLHTADPGAAGTQSTSELAYAGYARKALDRIPAFWTFSGGNASPTGPITFAESSGGAGGVVTFVSIGVAAAGAGKVLLRGQIITPATGVPVSEGVTPYLKAGTVIKFLDV